MNAANRSVNHEDENRKLHEDKKRERQ